MYHTYLFINSARLRRCPFPCPLTISALSHYRISHSIIITCLFSLGPSCIISLVCFRYGSAVHAWLFALYECTENDMHMMHSLLVKAIFKFIFTWVPCLAAQVFSVLSCISPPFRLAIHPPLLFWLVNLRNPAIRPWQGVISFAFIRDSRTGVVRSPSTIIMPRFRHKF